MGVQTLWAPPGGLAAGVLDPDRDEARRLLEEELRHPDYHRSEPIIQRILNWFLERLDSLIGFLPGSNALAQVLLFIVVVLVAVAIVFALRGRWRHNRLRTKSGTGSVFDDPSMTSAEYRARAAAAMAAQHWSAAVLDSYRAIAARADERALLDEVPGRTAHEIALALEPIFPDHADQIARAGDLFDAVRYGDLAASQDQARWLVDLEVTLEKSRPVHQPGTLATTGFGVPR